MKRLSLEAWMLAALLTLLATFATTNMIQDRRNYSREAYDVWMKVHVRDDISYEEWKLYKRSNPNFIRD